MGVKRLFLLAILVVAASVAIVPGASADDFADEPCPDVANVSTCPAGTVAVPYSLQFQLAPGSGCGPGLTTWSVDSGNFPPGLSLNSGSGAVSGTPTQAGNFTFYIKVSYPVLTNPACNGGFSDHQFTIPIRPEIPRLILQPEQSGVPSSTVGSAFSLQMTSNLPDPKTWSIVSGSLPAGLQMGSTDGLISGTPTTAGTYPFTVSGTLSPDPLVTPPRSDTKALSITVRDPLTITGPGVSGSTAMPASEVGVPFEAAFTADGGNEAYGSWTLVSGALPRGLALAADGTITGTPRAPGRFAFSVSITDTEAPTPRTATRPAVIIVAAKLDIVTERLRPAKVGKLYRAKLASLGGVKPTTWKATKGPLPRGVRLDRKLGILSGTPRKAGTYRLSFEVTDELGVRSTQPLVLVVTAPKKT